MTVETRNAALSAKAAQWARVRHAVAGSDTVRENATDYIPQLSGQTRTEYASYIQRPVFLEATGRTRDAMTGLATSRAPAVVMPASIEYLAEDIDADGSTLGELAAHMVDELQETGFGALLTTHNGDPANPGTAAAPSGRPLLSWYPAEAVVDWKHATVGGSRVLAQLRVIETVEEADPSDEFTPSRVEQIVVHDLDAAGNYRIRKYREDQSKTRKPRDPKWRMVAGPDYPVANGAPLKYVPGRLVSASNRRTPGNAPLAAIAEVNLSHWRSSADYEHALHFCGLPTAFAVGVSSGGTPRGDVIAAMDANTDMDFQARRGRAPATQGPAIKLGSANVITFENPQADMKYLSLPTDGIGALRTAIDGKERMMGVLGARMLVPEGGAAESGVALAVKRSGESSALVRIANAVSNAITECLQYAAEWAGVADDISFTLDTSWAKGQIDGATLATLLSACNAGKISRESFIDTLRTAGFIADNVSTEEELQRIADDPTADPLASYGSQPFQFGNAA